MAQGVMSARDEVLDLQRQIAALAEQPFTLALGDQLIRLRADLRKKREAIGKRMGGHAFHIPWETKP